MIYLIPAAGKGSRLPRDKWGFKPLIKVHGKTLLEYSIRSLDLSRNDLLVVVVLAGALSAEIDQVLRNLKVPCRWDLILLQNETSGQADTAYQATSRLDSAEALVVHNCDTAMNIGPVETYQDCSGLIWLFESDSPHFSYVSMDSDGLIMETAEKIVISNLATTGTYYFSSIQEFRNYYQKTIFGTNEHFVAPIYNTMILDSLRVRGQFVQAVFPLGTPADIGNYSSPLQKQWIPKW